MRVYLSHAMRGQAGTGATVDAQAKNCAAAIEIAWKLRHTYGRKLDLYVPAETEPFVQDAYDHGFLTVKQILDVDCRVLKRCDAMVVWVPEGDSLQGGRLIEYDYALLHNIPVIVFKTVEQAEAWLEHLFTRG